MPGLLQPAAIPIIPSFCQNLRLMRDQTGNLQLMSEERCLSVGKIPASLDGMESDGLGASDDLLTGGIGL